MTRRGKIIGSLAAGAAAALSILSPAAAQQASAENRVVTFYGDPAVPDISGIWLGAIIGVPGKPADPNRGPADGRLKR